MAASGAGAVLLEARPFRPFKSSEEYLYAMKEDLAEWLTVLYPELRITADNFLDRLDTGVALCRHANAVRESARLVLARAGQAALAGMAGGAGGASAGADVDEEALALSRALRARAPVSLLPAARPGTFFARDNLSNFIEWCRRALGVLECLLFETDDLCLRKNERHVVLCLLEVARRGAVLGMPAPLLVQMERQIDRELAGGEAPSSDAAIGLAPAGPQAQVVTNDLRSLDERVRDLVARCSCPTQFPMVRVSEGKYRIGDTRLLIFVRILRSHVMVRVGGGWDTLAHYLDKHDPCRCRAAHRPSLAARLARPAGSRPYADLGGATVLYDRPEPASLPYASAAPAHRNHTILQSHSDAYRHVGGGAEQPMSLPYIAASDAPRRLSSPERAPRAARAPLAAHLSPSRSVRTRSGSPARRSASPERRAVVATPHLVPSPHAPRARSPRAATPPADGSDNGSEVSDEGYRSLGVLASPSAPAPAPAAPAAPASRHSLHSQNSADDADSSERLDTDDGCPAERVDEHVSLSTGLRKTDFSGTLYGGGGARSKPASPAASPPHPASPERAREPAGARSPAPPSPARAKRAAPARPPPAARSTWAGRAAPAQPRAKPRAAIAADTFRAPKEEPFRRGSPLRASSATPRAAKPLSPLLEQILRSTESARDDAGVLRKMKDIIRQYSGGEGAPSGGGDADYADFTSAWVMSDGKLERSTSTRQLAAPRRDARAGASRIPAPLPAPLATRRSTSTANFH